MTPVRSTESSCVFCRIVSGEDEAHIVERTDSTVAFLDRAPLFEGHVLVVPTRHVVTLPDLEPHEIAPFFETVQRLSAFVPKALRAQGTFVAMNNIVSQSVAHLHAHVVPRTKGDGLRGFFWPRKRYESESEAARIAASIADLL